MRPTNRIRDRLRRPSVYELLALAGTALAVGGVAYATIPSADGVIHACYTDTTGALRVVDADAVGGGRCADTETALTWNQKGPAGAQGPPGSTGATGPAGGLTGVHTVKAFGPLTNATTKTVTASCGPGEIATGGGHNLFGTLTGRNVTISRPTGGDPPTAWVVRARALAPIGKWRVRAFAVCAKQ